MQNILNKTNNALAKSLQRLSTGMRINSAADDAAGYYVSQGLNAQIRGIKQAQNNITMGASFLSTAEDTMKNMTDMLNRLNDLALQGASTTLSDTERSALTNEANALVEEIKKQNKETTFNGKNVFGSVSEAVSSNVGVSGVSSDTVPSGYTAIYTAEDLNNVKNNLSGKYILMADIDLSSIENWEPIGTSSNAYTGTFDGNGHVIKNLTIDRPDTNYIGLFGHTSDGTEIKNLGLEDVDIKGHQYVAGIGGMARGTISNCYVTGNVTGNRLVGGLIGENYTTITNCYVECNISGNEIVGGLVGGNWGTIMNSYSTVNITSERFAGLICGCTGTDSIQTNIWADKNNSQLSTFGEINLDSSVTNCISVEHSEFTSHEFWDKQGLDSNVWEMSCSIPPVLKGVGTNNINWYFRESNNDFRLQVGADSDPSANSMTINTGLDLGAMAIDFSSVEGCLNASRCAQAAIDAIAKRTSAVGISQSRLENATNVNNIKIENLTAAYTNIVSADTAEETANYTQAQIMAETTSALMTQTQYFQANLLLNMIKSLG